MIELDDLRKTYHLPGRDVVALGGVDLEVAPGEVYGVVGESGAGKSTLLRCVNLLERPDSGTVTVAGQDLTSLRGEDLRKARQQIGMIFQHFELLAQRTVAANVALPLELAGVKRRQRDLRVDELLDLVGLADKASAFPAQLSGGQKQRVGIARALAAGPQVLLCDEATSALDPDTTRSILGLLRDVTSRLGVTVLLITHEYEVVKSVCDSVALLKDGKVVEKGPIASLLSTPNSVMAHALLPRLPAVEPATSGGVIADLTFLGDAANRPVITETARTFDIDISVVAGALESLAGLRVGRLRVELLGAAEACEGALQRFGELELAPEVHRV